MIRVKSGLQIHTCNKHCESGMGAMGHPIPISRMQNALEAMRDMLPNASTGEITEYIGRVASYLEDDQPYKAERYWKERDPFLDLTGYYRLLATLLAG